MSVFTQDDNLNSTHNMQNIYKCKKCKKNTYNIHLCNKCNLDYIYCPHHDFVYIYIFGCKKCLKSEKNKVNPISNNNYAQINDTSNITIVSISKKNNEIPIVYNKRCFSCFS